VFSYCNIAQEYPLDRSQGLSPTDDRSCSINSPRLAVKGECGRGATTLEPNHEDHKVGLLSIPQTKVDNNVSRIRAPGSLDNPSLPPHISNKQFQAHGHIRELGEDGDQHRDRGRLHGCEGDAVEQVAPRAGRVGQVPAAVVEEDCRQGLSGPAEG
jgi:hypothetical protein